MRTFKLMQTIIFAFLICASLASCGGGNNKVNEGQKALDAAVQKHGNAVDIQYQLLERREYYKSIGDTKNAEYYDRLAKEQAKEVERLRQEREKIRRDTYGEVFK